MRISSVAVGADALASSAPLAATAYENAPPLDVKVFRVTVMPRVRAEVELTLDQAKTPIAMPSLICAPCVLIVLLSTVTRVSPSQG